MDTKRSTWMFAVLTLITSMFTHAQDEKTLVIPIPEQDNVVHIPKNKYTLNFIFTQYFEDIKARYDQDQLRKIIRVWRSEQQYLIERQMFSKHGDAYRSHPEFLEATFDLRHTENELYIYFNMGDK